MSFRWSERWSDPFLICAVVFALAYRIVLLLTLDAHAHYDEAIIGVMARHILEHGERPLFFYGQNYGGGGAFEAYCAAALFALFGESAFLLKLTPLLISLAAIPAAYFLALRFHGRAAARLTVVLFVLAPPTLEWSIAARGGYIETVFLSAALFLLAAPLIEGRAAPARRIVALGAVAGFAMYIFGLIAPTLVTIGILVAARRVRLWRTAAFTAIGLVLGGAPLVYDNIAHGFVNLRHLATPAATAGAGEWVARFGARLGGLVVHDLPAFFTPWIDDFPQTIPVDAWIYAAAVVALCAVHAWTVLGASSSRARRLVGPEAAPLLYVMVYALLYAGSRFAGLTPRYLFGLYPVLAVLAAAGAARLFASTRSAPRGAGAVLVAALVAVGGVRAALLPRAAELREYTVVTRGDSTQKLLGFLRARGIRTVFASPPVKWRLAWEGRGDVAAATLFFPQDDWFRYPAFESLALDRTVRDGEPAAFITHAEFAFETFQPSSAIPSLLASQNLWESALAAREIAFQRERVDDYFVYHEFSKNLPALLAARERVFNAREMLADGRTSEARRLLNEARALDPEDPEIERLLR
ncbi:MAG: ArnT family glycosyltransferase [bacterium]